MTEPIPRLPEGFTPLFEPAEIVGGRYEVVRLIGRGGFSQVYEVRDAGGHPFALKVLSLAKADENERKDARRLVREGRVLAQVRHPNLVRYERLDVDPETSRLYLVLELVEGMTLRRLIHERRLGLLEILDIGVGVAAGLGALHEQALIHRDIKPENLMVGSSSSSTVKILDLGLIKAQGVSQGTTRPLGTYLYMSPEALNSQDVTPSADVYSLGHTLYEMCAGEHAFTETGHDNLGLAQAEVIVKHVTDRFVVCPLSERLDHFPVELSRCIERAMRRDPAARQPNGQALALELGDLRRRLGARDPRSGHVLETRLGELGLDPSETAWLRGTSKQQPFAPVALTQPIGAELLAAAATANQAPAADHPPPRVEPPEPPRIQLPPQAATLRSAMAEHDDEVAPRQGGRVAPAPAPAKATSSTLEPSTAPPAPGPSSWLDRIDGQHLWIAALALVLGATVRFLQGWLF